VIGFTYDTHKNIFLALVFGRGYYMFYRMINKEKEMASIKFTNEDFVKEFNLILDDDTVYCINHLVKKVYENAYLEGHADGYRAGYNIGYKEGYNDGYDGGRSDGFADGFRNGKNENN